MKSILTFSFWAILCQFGFSQTPTNGLVARYLFSGNANDNSGNNNNGTVMGATLTTDRCGNINQAYSFDGINDFIEVPDAPSLRPSKITFSVWVKPNTNNPGRILSKTLEPTGNGNYLIDATLSNRILFWLHSGDCNSSGSARWKLDTVNINWGQNRWSHICCTFDSLERKVFFNGQLLKTTPTIAGFNVCQGSPLRFGKFVDQHPLMFNGALDDIRIYNRALNPTEVLSLYNDNCSTTGITTTNFSKSLKISPNPLSDLLNLEFVEHTNCTDCHIEIRNLLGELIQYGQINAINETINVSNLKKGYYFITIKSKEGQATKQFIKM